jgi:hypothetical protein
LAASGYLAKGCKIWLPNIQCIDESVTDFYNDLNPYFVIRKEVEPKNNPLYLATEDVEKELLKCPDALTNETQIRPVYDFSDSPFYVLELRPIFLKAPMTPTRANRSAAAVVTPVVEMKEETAATKKRKLAAEVAVSKNAVLQKKGDKASVNTRLCM